MKLDKRPWILAAICLLIASLFLLYGPIAQQAHYHEFADQRHYFGLQHTADFLSNLGFAIVGLMGLYWLSSRTPLQLGEAKLQHSKFGYYTFFIAIILTSIGSSWYHWAPDNTRLVWDRLPITLGCAGIVDAVLSEHLNPRLTRLLRLLLLALAPASVFWWQYTDLHAAFGDLRPYLYLQLLPLVLIPLVLALYRSSRSDYYGFGFAIGAYVIAKILELNDHAIYELTGMISGHTLKHFLATLAAWAIYRLLLARSQS